MHKLAMLALIPWTQERPQDSKCQGCGSKVNGPKFHYTHVYLHLLDMGSPQNQTGHIGLNAMTI